MRPERPGRNRRGTALAEAAVVYPVAILLVIGTMIAALGIFRRNQIACLAREGARWASVHGPKYQADQQKAAPTAADVVANAVTPRMVGLDPNRLTPALSWNTAQTPPTVTFSLSYQWVPETLFPTRTFVSTSTQPITY